MANILLNYYNFDGDWAKDYVAPYLTGKKVLILPLAFREIQAWDYDSWQNIYGKNGEKYQNIIRPFLAFGIDEEKICWLNCFDKCQNSSFIITIDINKYKQKIRNIKKQHVFFLINYNKARIFICIFV